jgi:hypothetical protein
MSKLSLYDLSNEFKALEEILIMDGGEITEISEELEKTLFEMIEKKTDAYIQFNQKLDDEMELAAKHIKRLQEFKKVRENAQERLKQYAIMCLERMGQQKISGDFGTISLRKPSQVLNILDEQKIPDEFASYVRIVDKTKVKDAIKKGQEVEGASLSDGKKSVMFKTKGMKDE